MDSSWDGGVVHTILTMTKLIVLNQKAESIINAQGLIDLQIL